MSKASDVASQYPVRVTAGFTAAFGATLGLNEAFGWWHWTPGQTTAVTGFASAFLAFVLAVFVHDSVTPMAGQGEHGETSDSDWAVPPIPQSQLVEFDPKQADAIMAAASAAAGTPTGLPPDAGG